ncbi:SelT/SelW/SelH family protein [Flexithrix dorotheae]|uniref:SelT/SelW/SelH family protein n=1 Tax=Flexithrix dorotheae TaxID=70993 RepID=UPI0005C6C7D4|nr:SelT/SelW/SelH family protein [Flexithrix dorotheae]
MEADSKPVIKIIYCTQCRWMLRATWMAQEILTTFVEEVGEVALKPGKGGIFEIWVDGNCLFSFKEKKRFPEIKELKQLVRDKIAPEKSLGHSDKKNK